MRIGAKFLVVENDFPVFSSEIPCSIIQGIASKVPKASTDLSVANAANGPVLLISLFISLLAGNRGQRLVRYGLRRQPASRVAGELSASYKN